MILRRVSDLLPGAARRSVKEQLESMAWRIGLDVQVRRADPRFPDRTRRSLAWLQRRQFRTILDIGAHIGQSSAMFRTLWPDAQLFAFEPVPSSYQRLCDAMTGDARFTALPYAISDVEQDVEMFESGATETSSLLEMSEQMRALFPHASSVNRRMVRARRLDDVAAELTLAGPLLVKLDVQGAEQKVIRGGAETLRKADAVIAETSFAPLYEEAVGFEEVYDGLRELGFSYAGSLRQLLSPADGAPLEQDSVFLRRS